MVHGRPGSAPQTGKREQFGRLIARGVPNAEACWIVGINRRTGTRWRYGREITSSSGRCLQYPPVIIKRKRDVSPRYLSEDERVRTATVNRPSASRAIRVCNSTPAIILRFSMLPPRTLECRKNLSLVDVAEVSYAL